jgi:hypothetical protein
MYLLLMALPILYGTLQLKVETIVRPVGITGFSPDGQVSFMFMLVTVYKFSSTKKLQYIHQQIRFYAVFFVNVL